MCRNPSHLGRHLSARHGARAYELPDGTVRLFEPHCGVDHQHGPDVLWFTMGLRYLPPGTCNTTSPYLPNPNPLFPNPNNPSGGLHDNITRHWATMPIPYTVNTPPAGIPGACALTDIFCQAPAGHTMYSWATFTTDIQAIVNAVANSPYVNVSVQFQAPPSPPIDYESGNPTFGTFIWDNACNPAGPTGNNINEFIFRSRPGIAGAGITSMDVDPTTGVIQECDVIFSSAIGTHQVWNQFPPTGGTSPGPKFSTGMIHEVGHFFGLDHTNLSVGAGSTTTPPPNPQVNGFPAPIGINWVSNANYPAMVGQITVTPNDYVAAFIATGPKGDDLAGLAQIYPVLTITATKRPLINDFAIIQGQTIKAPPSTSPLFGRNIYLIPHATYTGQTTLGAGVPAHGKISGTARLGPLSVLGYSDTASGAQGTAEFRIVGIVAASIFTTPIIPTAWDVVTGPLDSVGIASGGGILSDWWFDPLLNPANNLFNSTATQEARISSDAQAGTPLGSLTVIPGTIITMSPIPADGTSAFDNTSRPLVDIQPRGLSGGSVPTTLTIDVHHNIMNATVAVSVNGVGMPATTVFTNATSPISPAGLGIGTAVFFRSRFTVSIAPGTPQPVYVRATAKEPGPSAIPLVPGVSELWY